MPWLLQQWLSQKTEEPTRLPLLGSGRFGKVYDLGDGRCVKHWFSGSKMACVKELDLLGRLPKHPALIHGLGCEAGGLVMPNVGFSVFDLIEVRSWKPSIEEAWEQPGLEQFLVS